MIGARAAADLGRGLEVVEIDVPLGGRVRVMSDLLLQAPATTASSLATRDLAASISAWAGPGVLLFAGNTLDLLTPAERREDDRGPGGGGSSAAGQPTSAGAQAAEEALACHPELVAAVRQFLSPGLPAPERVVVCMPGSRDARIGWDGDVATVVRRELGAELASAATLRLHTGSGTKRVGVEPGQRFDPRFAACEPQNPADTPLGHHLLSEIMPALGGRRRGWLEGADRLTDQAAFPRFVASRFAYRRLARHLWWIVIPFAAALVLNLPLAYAVPWLRQAHHRLAGVAPHIALVAATTLVNLVLAGIGVAFLVRRTWTAVRGVTPGLPGADNEGPRAAARELITNGWAGLVTGHTLCAELANLGAGFYANCGAAAEVVVERPSRGGLPPVFLARRQLSWVELEAGADLHARLLYGSTDLGKATLLERLVGGRHEAAPRAPEGTASPAQSLPPSHPTVVASFPGAGSWPAVIDPDRRRRRDRRLAAALIALSGFLDLLSAVTPPLRARLRVVLDVIPLGVAQAAAALVALAGLALLALAVGIRRGQRRAWAISLALLVGTAVFNLVKGADFEETTLSMAVAGILFAKRRSFSASAGRISPRRSLVALAGAAVGSVLLTAGAVEATLAIGRRTMPLGVLRLLQAISERLVGLHGVPLPHRIDEFVTPALLALGIGLAVAVLALASRPVVERGLGGAEPERVKARANEIVARYGTGTLDYFALRDDKSAFIDGETLVAYAVYGGVCLVSPDPIGPAAEREKAWAVFRSYADRHAWTVAVLGASEGWLPIYRSSGMHDLYVGDEGVVDVQGFSLEGGRHKALRQAVNRIARHGYGLWFHHPREMAPELVEELRGLMDRNRRGEAERGFSMTLGRAFDPADPDLLVAVARDPSGKPVAFCQYVPAPGINGYSLDLMRRDDGPHPNGLIDFIVVGTIHYLREQQMEGLGLNFATMRAVLAGESGAGLPQRIERWMLRRMSGSMQIESLWRFNAKYDPRWQPRFVVYESPERAPAVAIAVARAESFWELPLVGRFLVPDQASGAAAPARSERTDNKGPAAPSGPFVGGKTRGPS